MAIEQYLGQHSGLKRVINAVTVGILEELEYEGFLPSRLDSLIDNLEARSADTRVTLVEMLDQFEAGEVAPLLAALVRHGTLTLEEAIAVCRYSLGDCLIYLDWLYDLGVTEEENGRYQITTFWYPEVRRYLKRKNLLTE